MLQRPVAMETVLLPEKENGVAMETECCCHRMVLPWRQKAVAIVRECCKECCCNGARMMRQNAVNPGCHGPRPVARVQGHCYVAYSTPRVLRVISSGSQVIKEQTDRQTDRQTKFKDLYI